LATKSFELFTVTEAVVGATETVRGEELDEVGGPIGPQRVPIDDRVTTARKNNRQSRLDTLLSRYDPIALIPIVAILGFMSFLRVRKTHICR
jgi:molybdopterin converting factor small subunit